jgi:hypothetical protein
MTPETVVNVLKELASTAPVRAQQDFLLACAACVAELMPPADLPPGDKITDLHVWIATMRDGSEGIVAGGLEGLGLTTMMSSRRHVAEGLAGTVRNVQAMAADNVVSVRLVTFTSTEGTRQ